MRALIAALLVGAAAAAAAQSFAAAPAAPSRVLAVYFADYDSGYSADQIPGGAVTDVIYAFAAIDARGRCALGDPYADTLESFAGSGAGGGQFGQLALLERRYPELSTEISIGGWAGASHFSAAASTPARRRALVRSCIDLFLRQRPGLFDGFDIDWEFPVAGGATGTPASPADRGDATALLLEFRRQLDALGAETHRRYLLTAAMPAFRTADGSYTPSRSWDLRAASRIVDWFNLMTYDLTTTGTSRTDFESALAPTPGDPSPAAPAGGDTIAGAVSFYEAAGVPASRIVLGTPFYGHVFTHVPATGGGLFQHFRRLGPTPSYAELLAGYLPFFRRFWSPIAQEPWLYSHHAREFVSYEDPASLAAKARYVLAQHLRGAMVWEISMDDGSHDLLNALAGPLLGRSAG